MLLQKFFVDQFSAAKAFLGTVPESNAILAEFPAQAHFPALVERQEIDQADVEVFD